MKSFEFKMNEKKDSLPQRRKGAKKVSTAFFASLRETLLFLKNEKTKKLDARLELDGMAAIFHSLCFVRAGG
jgi:hypothetical protein